jgi:hypothetical protein
VIDKAKEAGVIEGLSYLELPLADNPDKAARVGLGLPLRGTLIGVNHLGEQGYRFLVVHPETGQVTTTTAILSADGSTLTGKSVSETERGTLEYSWTAVRMTP